MKSLGIMKTSESQSKISIIEIFCVQIELVSAVDMRSETVFGNARHEILNLGELN